MMINSLHLKKDSYDPFIDFLKGVCIIFVLLNHCFPVKLQNLTFFAFWGGQAIPIFILIQVFHAYKRGFDQVKFNLKKLWNRIIAPFLYVEGLIIFVKITELYITNGGVKDFLGTIFYGGGRGPGSYYPWLYSQFAIILPIMAIVFRKFDKKQLLLIFVVASQSFEILSCIIDMPDWPYYSLLFIRYTFLIYLGYLLVVGIELDAVNIIISVISVGVMGIFAFSHFDMLPLFKTNTMWKICQWPCYMSVFLLIGVIRSIRDKCHDKWALYIEKIGRLSYEIFLFQLFYYVLVSGKVKILLSVLNNKFIEVSDVNKNMNI